MHAKHVQGGRICEVDLYAVLCAVSIVLLLWEIMATIRRRNIICNSLNLPWKIVEVIKQMTQVHNLMAVLNEYNGCFKFVLFYLLLTNFMTIVPLYLITFNRNLLISRLSYIFKINCLDIFLLFFWRHYLHVKHISKNSNQNKKCNYDYNKSTEL